MVFQYPRKWNSQLSTAEWWYNTSFHTSLKMRPFQALYGFFPPMISEGIIPNLVITYARDLMQARLAALKNIKHNLLLAQERMKKICRQEENRKRICCGGHGLSENATLQAFFTGFTQEHQTSLKILWVI
jgi:hypothetical protein